MSQRSIHDVRLDIEHRIADLPVNAKLPSVRELVRIIGGSHVTVFAALKSLENRGFIYSIPRKGYYRGHAKDSEKVAAIGTLTRFEDGVIEEARYVRAIRKGMKEQAERDGTLLESIAYRKDIHVAPIESAEIENRNLSAMIVLEVEDPAAISMLRNVNYPVLFAEADVFGFGASVIRFSEDDAFRRFFTAAINAGAQRALYLPSLRRETRNLITAGLNADRRIHSIRQAAAQHGIAPEDVRIVFGRAHMKYEMLPIKTIRDWLVQDDRLAAIVGESSTLRHVSEEFQDCSSRIARTISWETEAVFNTVPHHHISCDYKDLGITAVRLTPILNQLHFDVRPRQIPPDAIPGWTLVQADRTLLCTREADLVCTK